MSSIGMSYQGLDEIFSDYQQRRDAINARLDDFARVPREDHFSEMVYCLLTPQSSAVNAGKAVALLSTVDLRNKRAVAKLLQRPEAYIRFHNTKAGHVVEAAARFAEVSRQIAAAQSPQELRGWLVEHVKGLGWKESSHFLRNIGLRGLAILDRHILRNLKHHGVIDELPKTLTKGRYLEIERQFSEFAEAVHISLDELDLLFWSRETGEILK